MVKVDELPGEDVKIAGQPTGRGAKGRKIVLKMAIKGETKVNQKKPTYVLFKKLKPIYLFASTTLYPLDTKTCYIRKRESLLTCLLVGAYQFKETPFKLLTTA